MNCSNFKSLPFKEEMVPSQKNKSSIDCLMKIEKFDLSNKIKVVAMSLLLHGCTT